MIYFDSSTFSYFVTFLEVTQRQINKEPGIKENNEFQCNLKVG